MKSGFTTYGLIITLLVLPVLYFLNEGVSLAPLDPHQHVIQNGLTYLSLLLFSYFNHTRFVPNWYLTKRYGRYVVIVLSCLAGILLIPHRIEQLFFLQPPAEQTPIGWIGQILWKENLFPPRQDRHLHASGDGQRPPRRNTFPPGFRGRPPKLPLDSSPLSIKLGIIFLLGSVSTLASVSILTSNRLRQMENDQLQAELRQLKAQIHPHFLFNTLNSIYALAIRKDDRTADTIVKLAEFMRYMIGDAHQHRVSLQKELDYLRNYIDLQKARLRDAVSISVSIEGDASRNQIAPLLLFTFVENAFKYGVNPDVESVIRIQVSVRDDTLRLSVFNRKVSVNPVEGSSQVGLQNAQERLRLLYPGKHSLRIDNADTQFEVNLTLQLA